MRKRFKAVFALLMAMMLLFSNAYAAQFPVMVTQNTQVYADPSTTADLLGTAPAGQRLMLLETRGSWARVSNDGDIGYMNAGHLVTTTMPAYVGVAVVKIYANDSTTAKELGVMGYGERMNLVSLDGDWAYVSNPANGKMGYCLLDELVKRDPNILGKTAYVAPSTAIIYTKPIDEQQYFLAQVNRNTRLSVVAQFEDEDGEKWYRLKNGSQYGYIPVDQTSASVIETVQPTPAATATPEITPTPVVTPTPEQTAAPEQTATPEATSQTPTLYRTYVYVTSNTATIQTEPSANSPVYGLMSFGDKMWLESVSGEWGYVRNLSNNRTGYCLLDDISLNDPCTLDAAGYAKTSGVKIYAKPMTAATVKGTLAANATVKVVGLTKDGAWLRLANNAGFVQASAIGNGTQPTATPTPAVTAAPTATATAAPTATPFEKQTVYVSSNTAKIYASMSTSARVLGTMSFGDAMMLEGITGEWAYVRNLSHNGAAYCLLSDISAENPCTLDTTGYAKTSGVKIYAKPMTAAAVKGTLAANATVKVVGLTKDGAWLRLANNAGFVQASAIGNGTQPTATPTPAVTAAPTATPTVEPTATPFEKQTVYVSSNTAKIYASMSTSARVLGTMCFGDAMMLEGITGEWAYVRNLSHNGTAYCLLSDISAENPCTLDTTGYAKTSGVKIYAKPLSTAAVKGTLAANATVKVVGLTKDGAWLRLANNAGFVQASAIGNGTQPTATPTPAVTAAPTATPTAAPTATPFVSHTVYVKSYTAKIYARESTSSTVLGTMCFGDAMMLEGITGEWAYVRNLSHNGTAYCLLSELSAENPCTLDTTGYASANGVKIFAKPLYTSVIKGTLALNAMVKVVGVTADGVWLRLANNAGFVPASYIVHEIVQPTATAAPDVTPVPTVTPTVTPTATPVPTATPFARHTVYVSSNTAKIYARESTSSTVLGTMCFGDAMMLEGINGEWAYVRNLSHNGTAYCLLSDISAENPCTAEITGYAKISGVKIYAKPLSTAAIKGTLAFNATVKVVGLTKDGAWLRLANNAGFVQASEISAESVQPTATPTPVVTPVPTATATAAPTATPFVSHTVYVKSNTAKIYARESTSSTVLGTMCFGDAMKLEGINGDWAYVRNLSHNGTAYCRMSDLTAINPCAEEVAGYAKISGVKIYAKPLTSSAVLGTLSQNAAVKVVGVTPDGLWLRLADNAGFVSAANIDSHPISIPTVTPTVAPTATPFVSRTVYITSNTAKIYASASTSSTVLGTLCFGQSMTLENVTGDWGYVRNSDGNPGYCKLSNVSTENPNGSGTTMYAQSAGVKVYAAPLTSSTVLATVSINTTLKVIATTSDGDWHRVQNGSQYGYVRKSDLGTTKVVQTGVNDPYKGTASATIENVIALALAQYGKPYVYGAEGPDSYDCSGLTQYCFQKEAGIKLKRSAYAQGYDSKYTPISETGNLRRGDIVCFNTNSSDSDASDHVGIYLGGNYFVHASSGGGKVIVSSMGSGTYYNRVFSWGLRIVD